MQRIALYSQDTHGLGRMRRNIAIARALADDEPRAILLISGAGEAAILGLPEGADTLGLPAIEDAGHPGARCLGLGRDTLVRLRGEALRSALAAFRPDALIVDRLPAGLHGELRASFDMLHRMGTHLVLGLPDVLGDHERVWADWHVSDSIDVVRRHYDRVWVYGDPHVFDPVAEHGLPRDVRRMTRTPATSTARTPTPARPRGSGRSAASTASATASASASPAAATTAPAWRPRLRPDADAAGHDRASSSPGRSSGSEQHGRLEAAAARRDDLRIIRVLPGADTLIGMADQVVAMGGYHTTAEALAADRRALIVPSVPARRPAHPRRAPARARGCRRAADAALTPRDPRRVGRRRPAEPEPPDRGIDTDGLARLPMLLDELRTPLEDVSQRRFRRGTRFAERRLAAAPELAASAAG